MFEMEVTELNNIYIYICIYIICKTGFVGNWLSSVCALCNTRVKLDRVRPTRNLLHKFLFKFTLPNFIHIISFGTEMCDHKLNSNLISVGIPLSAGTEFFSSQTREDRLWNVTTPRNPLSGCKTCRNVVPTTEFVETIFACQRFCFFLTIWPRHSSSG
jgi:hypothetical protein